MKKTLIILSMLALAVTSCADGASENADYAYEPEATDYLALSDDVATEMVEEEDNKVLAGNSEQTETAVSSSFTYAEKVIREAYMSIEVEDYQACMDGIRSAMSLVDGYISNEYEYFSGTGVTNDVTIRVASKDFDKIVEGITDVADAVISKTVNSTDVTEEYVDLQSRMRSKQEMLEQFYLLLEDATTISEILTLENEIQFINEELERIKGRLNYLSNKTSYSTITVNIHKPGEEPYMMEANTYSDDVGEAFEAGFGVLQAIFLALVYAWPLLLVLVGVFITFKVVRAKRA